MSDKKPECPKCNGQTEQRIWNGVRQSTIYSWCENCRIMFGGLPVNSWLEKIERQQAKIDSLCKRVKKLEVAIKAWAEKNRYAHQSYKDEPENKALFDIGKEKS
jgi:transcription elongation factor Elf1